MGFDPGDQIVAVGPQGVEGQVFMQSKSEERGGPGDQQAQRQVPQDILAPARRFGLDFDHGLHPWMLLKNAVSGPVFRALMTLDMRKDAARSQ